MKSVVLLCTVLAIVTLLAGCDGQGHYDKRLVQADSLMWLRPDSALAIVQGIDDSTLRSGRDRAYRALLLTQARYKAYKPITARDNSAITLALDWYRHHSGDREKLTRATLYKGAIVEEFGMVDSAMHYYKTAEAIASEKDYANLGQINTRIAKLCQWHYGDMQLCYDKYKKALEYYRLTGNKQLQFDCLYSMAGCRGITLNDDPKQLLEQATQLAIELNDSDCYCTSQELLCRLLTVDNQSLPTAKQIALRCLNDYHPAQNHDLLLDVAQIYVKTGMADSARYYLDMVKLTAAMPNPEQVQARRYQILRDVARLEGNMNQSNYYGMLSHQVSDSIQNSNKKYIIQCAENTFNQAQAQHDRHTIGMLYFVVALMIALAIAALAAVIAFYWRKQHRIEAIVQELRHSSVNTHESLLNQLGAKDETITHFVQKVVTFMQMIIEANRKDSVQVIRQRVKAGIKDVTAGDDFWKALRIHVDSMHGGVITKLAEHPDISETDLRFIELTSCGFDYLEIAIIMGYNPKYISQKRKDIAEKLRLDHPLRDYLWVSAAQPTSHTHTHDDDQ